MTRAKHPGRTPAQRRALDAIGCGNFSPVMAKTTRDALLKAGLIEYCGDRILDGPPFPVCIAEYQMPVRVHMQWCTAVSEEETEPGVVT